MAKSDERLAPDDARVLGFHRSWVSNATMWSSATTWLLTAPHMAAPWLAAVAIHMWLEYSLLLITGSRRVPPDDGARSDCPVKEGDLREVRDCARRIRDSLLHLPDRFETGSAVNINLTSEPRAIVIWATNAESDPPTKDTVSSQEMDELASRLDPWLKRHFDRLLLQRQ